MSATGPETTPLEYLARADRELVAGNRRESALLMWKATAATFVDWPVHAGWNPAQAFIEEMLILHARDTNEAPA